MLYVFLVDTGTMMTFDMNLAMESVSKLQTVISRACHISEDKQVLLISGGESLDPHARVGRYSAGTDTNPIFLFSKTTIEAATPPSPSIHHGSDIDLHGQVEESLLMPPAYETVVSRTQLAVQFHEVDEDELRACINLVHDQHLQQQGWAAVVANLEDITVALKQRSDIFQAAYTDYLAKREQYLVTLSQIGDSLHLQTKIPLLSCLPLTQGLSEPVASTSYKVDDVKINVGDSSCSTLFQWINSQDPHHSLQDMVDRCIKAAEQFDDTISETLQKEVNVASEAVGNPNMKEVKGLEDRLYGLDQIMSGARKLVIEQSDMAKGFVQNQSRATNLRDKSILPDLCASHKKQLVAMLNNHRKLRDIKKKCRMAKEELAVNLHTRLRWVMFVEKKICDVDGKLTIYHESLRRLHKQLDIMRQIEEAPKVYAKLVVEVVRRIMFSQQFMEWANGLAEETKHLHTEEVKRRQSFHLEIGKHFLQSLFQGFEDLPPPFATEAPPMFDKNLPDIMSHDVEMLRQAVPELQDIFRVPNDIPVSQRMSFQTVSCHGKPVNDLTGSTTISEIDIIQGSVDNIFVHIDGSRLSLGEQVATCEPTEIIINPAAVSIIDKPDFPIPQSLSETLTLEMNSQVKGVDIGVTFSKYDIMVPSPKKHTNSAILMQATTSGETETARSTESDLPSSDKSVDKVLPKKRSHLKGALTSDTSPEGDTSQEFTTADFYFDESMPSSMIDSPPNKSSVVSEKGAVSGCSDKTEIIVSLEKELGSRQRNLHLLEEKLKTLYDICKLELPTLKENVLIFKNNVNKDKDLIIDNFVEIKKQIPEIIHEFVNQISRTHIAESKKLTQQHAHENEKVQNMLLAEQNLVCELNEQLEGQKQELIAQKQELIAQNQELIAQNLVQSSLKLQSDSAMRDLKNNHKIELDDMKQKNLLELELEVDKLREELHADIVKQESTNQNLTEQLKTYDVKLEECVHEKEVAIETLNKKFQLEKEEISRILEENYEMLKVSEMENIKEELEKDQDERFKKSESKIQETLKEEKKKLDERLMAEKEKFSKTTADLEHAHEDKMAELSCTFNKDKETLLKELRETLEKHHNTKLQEVESDFKEEREKLMKSMKAEEKKLESKEQQTTEEKKFVSKQQQTAEKGTGIISDELKLIQEKIENEFKVKLEKMILEEKEQHILELSNLEAQYQKDREDSLSSLKTSMTAEKQVQFNEAVEKVSREKEKMIESLKLSEETLRKELDSQKLSFDKLVGDNMKSEEEIWYDKLHQKDKEFCIMRHKLEDELALSRQQVSQYQQQLMGMSEMSVAPTDEGAMYSESVYKLPVSELEKTLKSKDIEISHLKDKIMEMSMTTSTKMMAQDKVSITSCKVGDLVLLCLDEPHDQYIVFTVRTTLHFLHSDCLDVLGLKTGLGEARKSWILAEITDKEYCQAKKPQNRFKVPVGTKFYRVKAIPWTRDPASQPSTSSK